MSTNPDVESAAQLVAFGVQSRLVAGQDEDYRSLLSRYRTDLDFRQLVDSIATGLGLRVTAANELGLFFWADPYGPFAYTLASWRRERGAGTFEDRILHGLAVVAIAAYFYPQASDLETERHRQATAAQVEQFLRAACSEIAKESDDPEIEREEWEQAASLYLRQKEVAATSDGRRPQKGTQSVISRAFDLLVEQGLVRKREEGNLVVYQPSERMRLQIAGVAGHEAYQALALIRRGHEVGA